MKKTNEELTVTQAGSDGKWFV